MLTIFNPQYMNQKKHGFFSSMLHGVGIAKPLDLNGQSWQQK